jgi:hypothetical protein
VPQHTPRAKRFEEGGMNLPGIYAQQEYSFCLYTIHETRRYRRMEDHMRTQTETVRLQDQEAITAYQQRLARERLRKRATKAMHLARAAAWRRFRRLPVNA